MIEVMSQVIVPNLRGGIMSLGLFEKLCALTVTLGGGHPGSVRAAGREVVRDREDLFLADEVGGVILGLVP